MLKYIASKEYFGCSEHKDGIECDGCNEHRYDVIRFYNFKWDLYLCCDCFNMIKVNFSKSNKYFEKLKDEE